MKLNYLIAIALSVFFFTYCKKDKAGPFVPIDPNPIDTIPVLPIDTVPFCQAMVNGQLWQPIYFGYYKKSALADHKSFHFDLPNAYPPPGWVFPKYELSLNFIERKLGRQYLGIYSPVTPIPAAVLVFYDVDVPGSRYKVDTLASYPAFVEITKIDTSTKLVEGIFECSMIRKDEPDSNGVVKHRWDFREGKFRMKYIEY